MTTFRHFFADLNNDLQSGDEYFAGHGDRMLFKIVRIRISCCFFESTKNKSAEIENEITSQRLIMVKRLYFYQF